MAVADRASSVLFLGVFGRGGLGVVVAVAVSVLFVVEWKLRRREPRVVEFGVSARDMDEHFEQFAQPKGAERVTKTKERIKKEKRVFFFIET